MCGLFIQNIDENKNFCYKTTIYALYNKETHEIYE